MKGEISVIDNLIQAVSILNNMDKYLEILSDGLSECDSLTSDYEHFIENTPIEQVDLKKLYLNMQEVFKKRRIIKDNITLRDNYKNLNSRLNNSANREILVQQMKNAQSKLGTKYHNRILKQEQINNLIIDLENKRRPGRPKKVKDEVIENV